MFEQYVKLKAIINYYGNSGNKFNLGSVVYEIDDKANIKVIAHEDLIMTDESIKIIIQHNGSKGYKFINVETGKVIFKYGLDKNSVVYIESVN